MKILAITPIIFPEIKVIKFAQFVDERGFFTEVYRKSDFQKIDFLKDLEFVQSNVSNSQKGVVRGLHLQWNPYQSKLVRVISGSMIDLFLDIRLGSPTFGKIGAYELNGNEDKDFGEWIWIPKGFAHGCIFKERTTIEYFCTSEYSSNSEASIFPLAADIDWSLADPAVREAFKEYKSNNNLMSDKDKKGFTLDQWVKDEKSKNFIYEENYK